MGHAPALAQPDHCRLMASWVAPGPAALLPRNQASALLLLLQPLYGTRRRWSPPISFLILTAFVQTFRLSPPPAHQCQAKLNIDCCTDKKGFDQSDPKIRMNPTSEPMTGTITNHIRISCPMRKVFTSFALANIYFPAQKKCSCLPFVSASPLKM